MVYVLVKEGLSIYIIKTFILMEYKVGFYNCRWKSSFKKLENSNDIIVAFIGDGTMGEGNTYEAFNIASTIYVPILFVLENNRYAQSTPVNPNHMKNFKNRFNSFDISCLEVDSNDINEIRIIIDDAIANIRKNLSPFAVILNTYRLAAHSKGDDTRDKSEIEYWKKKDPIKLLKDQLSLTKIEMIEIEEKNNLSYQVNKILK